ncbi:hypothetical protein RhiirA4_473102 [Rhizophagus irregularis]|uniref:Uncharacterized protein n=1 Tax=Rhizophagus irregularis TaxID=588596 RepID=A0A2I1H651_9GLOM|nr:hypothetical protein RhiirA4_473102 [Rhizophagus irregularis]
MLESEHTALDFLQRYVDEYGISISLADLETLRKGKNSQIRVDKEETFKKKAKIRVDKEAFLLGALDVAEILQENQIYWAFLLGVLDVTEILQENQIYCYLDGDDFTFPKTGTPSEFPPVLRASKFTDSMEKLINNLMNLKKVLGIL